MVNFYQQDNERKRIEFNKAIASMPNKLDCKECQWPSADTCRVCRQDQLALVMESAKSLHVNVCPPKQGDAQ
jgi:hypothetical protein